ncbi:MAG: LCP family protein [Lachnospiraceae bacterium]|nr:LCP family protein [Lachnospiraceae bacterium]
METIDTEENNKPDRLIKAAVIGAGVIALAAAALAVWFFVIVPMQTEARAEENVNTANALSEAPMQEEAVNTSEPEYRDITTLDDFGKEKWNEGLIRYDGKVYRYNDNLQNYLFMGIDNDNIAQQAEDGISGGQSDAMFLLVLDEVKRDVKIIAINRNIMVPVDVYDREGNFLVQMDLQICLQHGYGDGMKLSCMRAVEAVDRLLRDVPISGYMSLNMGGLAAVNDAIGGVEITPIESVKRGDIVIKKDETINLTGEQAYAYLRTRDVDKFASANDRLERQEQYILAFIAKLLQNPGLGSKLYEAGKDYIVASIDLPKLINSAKDMSFDENSLYTIAGETEFKDEFEQFHVDEDELIQLILEVFYERS